MTQWRIVVYGLNILQLVMHPVVGSRGVLDGLDLLDLPDSNSKKGSRVMEKSTPMERLPLCYSDEIQFAYGICLEHRYDEKKPPNGTIKIYFKILRNRVLEIREREKNIDIRMEITDSWDDHRISFSPEYTKTIEYSGSPDVTINWYDRTKENQNIWYPDGIRMKTVSDETMAHSPFSQLRFRNSDATPNTTFVSRVREIHMSVYCEFHSTRFPLDTTYCAFRLSNEDARGLQLLFTPDMDHIGTKTFEIDGFNITMTYEHGHDLEDSSYIGFNLEMRRILSPFLFQYYMPAASVVLVSQISLITEIPGRTALLATLFLTLTNIFINHMVLSYLTCFIFMSCRI